MPLFLNYFDTNFNKKLDNYLEEFDIAESFIPEQVKKILFEIKKNGDKALKKFSILYDNFDFSNKGIFFDDEEFENAIKRVSKREKEALDFASKRIFEYHKFQKPNERKWKDAYGVELGWKWNSLESVGIYVPGGTASYPSSVLMNAIPAKVAGVENIYMASPTPNGDYNPLILYAAKISGVKKIFKIGGAQAVGAFAYGTETIPKVNKIVGPGNSFVAEAKKQVFGDVGIDMVAGPSEILIIADENVDPKWVAIDLLSQAEHDVNAKCVLITDSKKIADDVKKELSIILKTLKRKKIANQSWEKNGAIILVKNLDQAVEITNIIAPEHLELSIKNYEKFEKKIYNAGSIFCGIWTPEAIGDYVGGPNHVLPTSKSSKYSSGLSVLDFLKRTSILKLDKNSLNSIGPYAEIIAKSEGLEAHAKSISMRIDFINSNTKK